MFLKEIDELVGSEAKGNNHRHLKTKLESQGWLGRVQTYLKQHALFADLCLHFRIMDEHEVDIITGMYPGGPNDEMVEAPSDSLLLRIFTLDSAPGKNVQQPPSENLPQQINMGSSGV